MARIASNVPLDEGRLSRFWDEGFAVFPHAFSKLAISTARDKIVEADKKELLPYEKLFGEIGAKDFDKHRLMASLPEGCDRIQMEITDLVDRLNMQWEIAKVVVIKSTPGGAEQTPHKDIPDFEIAAARKKKPETIQAGLLIAIMPETKLVVYSHCYSEARATKKLTMNIGAGSCLLFRGDLEHCGAAYSITNFRIHVTLKVQDVGWEDDVTEAAAVATYKCPYCPFISQIKEKVRHHRKRCSQHPNAEKIRARRRACDHEGKTCQLCGNYSRQRAGTTTTLQENIARLTVDYLKQQAAKNNNQTNSMQKQQLVNSCLRCDGVTRAPCLRKRAIKSIQTLSERQFTSPWSEGT